MKARPKVCHLTHDGSGSGGGATFSLAYFPRYLPEFDTFAVVGDDGDLAPRLEAAGVRTLTLPMSRPLMALLCFPRLWMIFRRERPDAVILHGQWGGFFGALAGRLAGIRTLFYYTQFPSFYTDWDSLRIVRNRLAESVTCQLVSKVVCQSEASRYQYLLRRFTSEDKYIHIPNAVEPLKLTANFDQKELRRSLDLPMDFESPLVISVSRLVDQKRIDWLLKAWALVEKEKTEAHLVIVGGGPLEKSLRQMADDLDLKKCHFLGLRSEGFRYYRAADVGVISSLFEGHPISLVEAMTCGCPMIGTEVDGIAETILDGETGLLVPPGDAPALAGAILKLLADPNLAECMGRAARLRATTLYDLDAVIQKQIALLKKVLEAAETT